MNEPIHCDEGLLRSLWAEGVTVTEIGRRIGASRTWVSLRARRLGLPPRAVNTGSLPVAKIVHAYTELGLTAEEIRDRLAVQLPTLAASTVRRILHQRGVEVRRALRRGGDTHLVECVRLFRAGWQHREIAMKLGLTTSQVGHRCRRVLGSGPRGRRLRIDVPRAMRMRRDGHTLREIAAVFGVTSQAVYYHVGAQHTKEGVAS